MNVHDLEEHIAALPTRQAGVLTLFGQEESIQAAPPFVLGSMPSALNIQLLAGFQTGPVRCYGLRAATVSINGIVLHDGAALTSDVLNFPAGHVRQMLALMPGSGQDTPKREILGQAVLLSGPGPRIYGHWLVDMLPRLYVLAECGFDPARLRYIVPSNCPFVVPLLGTFGIRPDQLIPYDDRHEALLVEDLLLPTNLRRGGRLHRSMSTARDYLLRRAFDARTLKAPWSGREKLFVARRENGQARTLANRAAVEAIAVERGYTLVHPEGLPVAEQIAAFSGAREIMGEYGSGMHNSIFSGPGTVVCVLRGSSHHPGFIQSAIGHTCRQPTAYVIGDSPLDAIDHTFPIDEQDLRMAIEGSRVLASGPNPTIDSRALG